MSTNATIALGDIIRVTVDRPAVHGDAIGRAADGRICFVSGAIQGETVDARVTEVRKDMVRAELAEVVHASPARVIEPCATRHAGCGGCSLLHIEESFQRTVKRDTVLDAMRRIGRFENASVAEEVLGVSSTGYRTTVRLAIEPDTGRPAYRRAKTNDPVVPSECLVAHPRLEDLIVESRFPDAIEVVLRVSDHTGERVAWVMPSAVGAEFPDDVIITSDRSGRGASITENVAGRDWRVSVGSFFQSGRQAAELLVQSVQRHCGDQPGNLIDLYAGVGVLGGSIANFTSLTSIEGAPVAAKDLAANLHGIPNARAWHGDVNDWTTDALVDTVIADPSRQGLGKEGVSVIDAIDPSTLVLVSCDAAALGRDAGLLVGLGFTLDVVEVLDLFPGTSHIETVSRFVR